MIPGASTGSTWLTMAVSAEVPKATELCSDVTETGHTD